MASSPALTCCTAWLPVKAPRVRTKGRSFIKVQSRTAPIRARVCSILIEPRSRATSSAVYGRSIPSQRSPSHSLAIWLVPFFSRSTTLSLLSDAMSVHCIMHLYAHICANWAQASALFRVMGRRYVANASWQEDRGGWSGLCAGPRGLHAGRYGCSSLVQVLVTREGQELYELVVGGDTGEEFGGLTELVLFPAFRADDVGFDLLQFLVECFVEEVFRHLGAVFEDTSRVVDPLPHLGAADLRRRCVLHQVEDGYRAAPSEPGREVLHTDRDVVSEAVHGDLALGFLQQVLCGGAHVGDLVELVGLGHVLVEDLFGERDHPGMGDPGPVMTVLRLALLVLAHFVVGELGPFGIVAAWDLGRHPPHRVRTAPVAGLDGKQRIGADVLDRIRHRVAGREEHVVFAELLDVGEDVVPPAAVEAGGVFAKLVEDLMHLERGEYRLDQDRSLDGAPRYTEFVLGQLEDVVPEPGLEVALHLGQIEVRSGTIIQ